MVESLSTLFLFGILLYSIKSYNRTTRQLKEAEQRKHDLEKLQRRIDRAVEMDTEIYKMYHSGDIEGARMLAVISQEEKQEIEKECRRLNIR